PAQGPSSIARMVWQSDRRGGTRHMRRREIIILLGGAPLAARSNRRCRLSYSSISGSRAGFARVLAAFHQTVNDTGYLGRSDVARGSRWAAGPYNRSAPVSQSDAFPHFRSREGAPATLVLNPGRAVQ